ncbi:MAG: hypothetical protein K0Q87_3690 [Neobacillus sp.]|nr:hypothetical protein [Neobacillus sp.]
MLKTTKSVNSQPARVMTPDQRAVFSAVIYQYVKTYRAGMRLNGENIVKEVAKCLNR